MYDDWLFYEGENLNMKTIDATGLSCPQPVLMTIQAIKKGETEIKVIVDNNTSYENVKRCGENNGFEVKAEEGENELITVFLNK